MPGKQHGPNRVRAIAPRGFVCWNASLPAAFRAAILPNDWHGLDDSQTTDLAIEVCHECRKGRHSEHFRRVGPAVDCIRARAILMRAERSQQALLWIGVAGAAILLSGWLLLGLIPPPAPTWNAAEIVAFYSAPHARAGIILAIVGGGFSVPWVAVIAIQMMRDEDGTPIWALLQLVTGAVGALLFFIPPVLWAGAAFSLNRDPELTKTIHEVSWIIMITTVSIYPLQWGSVAVVCFYRKADPTLSAFPRWLGYFTLWFGSFSELGVLATVFKTGPFAWNGIIPFWFAILSYSVWSAILIFTLLRAIRMQIADALAAIPATSS